MDNIVEPTPFSEEDVAATDRLVGRETTEAHRSQMMERLSKLRDQLMTLRSNPLTTGREPAFAFDPYLSNTLLPDGPGDVFFTDTPLPDYRGDVESLAFATVAELALLLRARKVTSTELTRMYLERLKTYGPRLLCVVSLCEERALAEAAKADAELAAGEWFGPLHGIPYAAKDLFAAVGTCTTFGAKPYAGQSFDFDATVITRLSGAGAVLLGKLSMGELAMGDVWFGGKTRNPWKPTTGSSGSSAGSASAVAAGLCGFALGTETYGSIVSPSVLCGTVGLRPTFGRVSRYGAMALSWTMDKIGPICRSSEDAALIFAAIQGPDGQDRTVRNLPFGWNPTKSLADLLVGVDEASFAEAQPAQKEVLKTLESLGVTLKPVTLPERNDAYNALPGITIGVEGAASFADLIAGGGLEDLVQQEANSWPNIFRMAGLIPATEYVQAQRVRRQLQEAMAEALDGIDAYVTVTYGSPSLMYANLTGHPTVITRCGKTAEGLPAMIEFTGNLYREDAILRLAHAYEQATAHYRQWPDVAALPEVPPPIEEKKEE